MKDRQCSRCGRKLPPGSLAYAANLRVFADFDGVLLEPEEGVDRQLKEVLEQIQECDPKELEQDVYEEFTMILCKKCRDEFVEQTRYPWKGPFWSSKGPGPFLH
jgi:hypothetical protein